MSYSATYSPEDNKLRMYATERLPADIYARIKDAGFIWAAKQQLFVAPSWTPEREDLVIELCGEIGDEDTSLVERAEERAERFEDYSDKRATQALMAKETVESLIGPVGRNTANVTDERSFGQVGLHSVAAPAAGDAVVERVPSAAVASVEPVVGEAAIVSSGARASVSPDLCGGASAVVATSGGHRHKFFSGEREGNAALTRPSAIDADKLCGGREPNRAIAGVVPLPASDMASAPIELASPEMIATLNDDGTTSIAAALPLGRGATSASGLPQDCHQAEPASRQIVQSVDHAVRIPQLLVAHHSERRARKDAQRIENGMRKAVKMWDTAQYWLDRSKGAIQHAKYKERPEVRHRRIKGLEADLRKQERSKAEAERFLKAWQTDPMTLAVAKTISNSGEYVSRCFPIADFPRQPPASQYEGEMSLWSAINGGVINELQAREIAVKAHAWRIERADRWIAHLNNRLAYERAMLEDQGGVASDHNALAVGGQVLVDSQWLTIIRVNKSNGIVNSVTTNAPSGVHWQKTWKYGIEKVRDYRPPTDEVAAKVKAATKLPPLTNYPRDEAFGITQQQWDSVYKDHRATSTFGATDEYGAHRVRHIMGFKARALGYVGSKDQWGCVGVFIVDAKETWPPKPSDEKTAKISELPRESLEQPPPRHIATPVESTGNDREATFDAMRDALAAGVKVVSAPQLFPTPTEIARQLVELAGIQPGQRILEPSAGTGNLLRAIWNVVSGPDCVRVVAVEINRSLADHLRNDRNKRLNANESNVNIRCADFLECQPYDLDGCCPGLGVFDRVIMNPPYVNGSDIAHVQHALKFIKPAGRLIAICANGPRQQRELKPIATKWIELPIGSFSDQGTNVNAAIMVIDH